MVWASPWDLQPMGLLCRSRSRSSTDSFERASELSIQGREGILRLGQKGFTDKDSEATKPGLPPKPKFKVPPSGLHELYGSCEQVGFGHEVQFDLEAFEIRVGRP